MLSTDFKYDVALSFSGNDREIARKIAIELQKLNMRVFYDEFEQLDLWGKNLVEHLTRVYSASARFCVPLLSRHYIGSRWTKVEIESANRSYILPIRLDDTLQGDIDDIGFLRFNDFGVEDIAALIVKKVEEVNKQAQPKGSISHPVVAIPRSVEGFVQNKIEDFRITEPDILARLNDVYIDADPKVRYNFASDIGRILAFETKYSVGPVYTSWRVENRLYLSTLPGVGINVSIYPPQQTFEFEIYGDKTQKIALVRTFRAAIPEWSLIHPDEFHRDLMDICADRSGCSMLREATLRVLQSRRCIFRFPITFNESEPEKFCDWINIPPTDLLFNWDRNPRLIPPSIGIWNSIYHKHTGEGILLFIVHGSWSNSALYSLEDTLDILLPQRYIRTPLENGVMRICIHLSNTPNEDYGNDRALDTDFVDQAIRRVYASLAIMIAAEREIPTKPLSPAMALPALDSLQRSLLVLAAQSIGAEYPDKVSDYQDDSSDWSKLHHTLYSNRLDLTSTVQRFDFGKVYKRSLLLQYIEQLLDF